MIKKIFPVLSLTIFSSMLGIGIIAPLLPLYADTMGASGVWLGIIFSGFAISRTILMPVFGRLSDRRGRKLFICAGLLFYGVISLGYIWAHSVYQLTIIRFLHGAAAGMILPIAQAYVGDLSPKGEEGKWMGIFNAAFFTGFGIGPLMGGALTDHFGITAAFSTMGGLNLMAFTVAAIFLPEIRREKTAATPPTSFRQMSASRMIKGLVSFRFSYAWGRGSLMAFLPIFAAIYLGLSSTSIGIILTVYTLLISVLQIVMGRIADRFNRKTLVIMGSLINLTFFALIPLAHGFWPLLGLSIWGGLGGAIAVSAASALVVEEGRRFGMGSAIAMVGTAMSIGIATGPILSGVITDHINIEAVFYSIAMLILAGICLFFWFTKREHSRPNKFSGDGLLTIRSYSDKINSD